MGIDLTPDTHVRSGGLTAFQVTLSPKASRLFPGTNWQTSNTCTSEAQHMHWVKHNTCTVGVSDGCGSKNRKSKMACPGQWKPGLPNLRFAPSCFILEPRIRMVSKGRPHGSHPPRLAGGLAGGSWTASARSRYPPEGKDGKDDGYAPGLV